MAAPGQSGAVIQPVPFDSIAKYSNVGSVVGRLREQAEWLSIHRAPGIVDLKTRWLNGYVMEELHPLPLDLIDPERLAIQIRRVLKRDVWCHEPEATIELDVFHGYLLERAREWAPEFAEDLSLWFRVIPWSELRYCLIHGDPTFSNTMLRGWDLVLIDPIPASARVPSCQAVDTGKILQSLLGYETVRFGWPLEVADPWKVVDRLVYDEDVEREATLFFAAVHFVRLLPYSPAECIPAFKEILRELVRVRHLRHADRLEGRREARLQEGRRGVWTERLRDARRLLGPAVEGLAHR